MGLFCSGCAVSLLVGPKFDPSLNWKVIETPHFRVYFHQGEDEWAKKTAGIAEEVHSILVPKLGWEPSEPTHLVLIDDLDATFGGTLPFPNNSIYISLTPPPGNPIPFLIRFDDYLRQVITHEYVHVLQLDMNTGFTSIMRALFGRQPIPLFFILNSALPNMWQPAWLIEGLATYEETAVGVTDRGDNAFAQMLLRMAILEDRFPTLDQAGGRDTWPDGEIQYLFGAGFYDYLAKRFGEEAIKDLNLEYSNNVMPFFVGATGKQVFGQTYQSLWENWKEVLKTKYHQQREQLEAVGLTPSTPITRRGDYNLGPRSNPQTRQMVYTSVNPHEYPALRIVESDGSKDRLLIRRNVGFTTSWSPDGNEFVFSQLEVYRNYSVYSDLYLYDFPKKKIKRLTNGTRLQDPDFHPDGVSLICVQNRLGKTRLVLYHLDKKEQEVLDWIPNDALLSHPRWSPNGKHIAATVWKNGLQGIYIIDPDHKETKPILMDPALDLTPTWSPDGKYLLFSSDRTGVYNLFAYALETGELFQVTNVLGGAFTPEITRAGSEIIFSAYSSHGFDLHRMPWAPMTWKKVSIAVQDQMQEPASEEVFSPVNTEPYSPWATLRPRFWTLVFGADESGLQLGIVTGGQDVLGRHKFDAVVLYGTETQRPAYSIQYVNDSFYPSIHFGFSDFAVIHTDLFENAVNDEEDYWERQQRLNLDITLPRFSFRTGQAITLGYRGEWLSGLTDVPSEAPPPEEGYLSGFRLSWRFGSAREYGFSISREEGRQLLASYTRFDRRVGSDFDQNRYIASWQEYQNLWWQHHVLAARLTGALATGDQLVQRTFQVGGPFFTEELIDPEQTDFFLRGYSARLLRGEKAALGSVEYRFPIWNIERGIRTWPFFFRRAHAALFFDIGNAWDEDTELSDFRRGIGTEIKMDMIFGHLLLLRLRLGFAYGLDEEGQPQFYFTGGNSF